MPPISARTMIAGVVGRPVSHSLSPAIQNAWISAAGLDAVYVAFSPGPRGFRPFVEGLRGGTVVGLNVTTPFKEEALALSDLPTERARNAGSANLLIFKASGEIVADNTDGVGLLAAFEAQAPAFDPAGRTIVIIGAGGAARGAAAAFLGAKAGAVRFVNRDVERAQRLAAQFGPRARAYSHEDPGSALTGAVAVINATPLGLGGHAGPAIPFDDVASDAVIMDMVYRPLRTAFLQRAAAAGLGTVDGLAMLIGQAAPSFESLFGRPAPLVDVRRIALASLES